jgi:hypothetical protein
VEGEHSGRGGVAGVVGVEATEDGVAAGDQNGQPGRVGPHAGGGDADPLRVDLEATDGIDGGFAEHDFAGGAGADPEVSQVFVAAGRHASPDSRSGPPQFRPDGSLGLSGHQDEDGIGVTVRVQLARLQQRLQQRGAQPPTAREVLTDAGQPARIAWGSRKTSDLQAVAGFPPEGSAAGRAAVGRPAEAFVSSHRLAVR